jgi:hypothetical protein
MEGVGAGRVRAQWRSEWLMIDTTVMNCYVASTSGGL